MTRARLVLLGIGLLVVVALGGLLYVIVERHSGGEPGATAVTTTKSATAGTTYVSDTASISISKIVTGSGGDTVTYFVADVRLSSGTDLKAGLSDKGWYGMVTSEIAEAQDAAFAVSGDFFGARGDGIVIRNGVIYRDSGVRTGLALYEDGHMEVYDETETSAVELLADGVWNAYSFGPGLLVEGAVPEDIATYEVDKNPRYPIQGRAPRTGIGVVENNHFVFVVVDGRSTGYSRGVTLEEFAQLFRELGCATAYNLDGGGSSTMYFMGALVNNPLGKGAERAIGDILYVG